MGELVAIPSVTGDERQIADYVEERYRSLGHVTVRHGNNVAARISGADSSKVFVQSGHLDTVPPTQAWDTNPYSLSPDAVNGGRLLGLGVSDMKSGLALMHTFAEEAAVQQLPCDQIHLFTTYEETSQKGAEILTEWLAAEVKDRYTTVGGVILEPTNAEYIGVGIRGDTNWRVTACGPGGHGSRDFEGTAIEKISSLIAALPGLRSRWADLYTDSLLGHPTINATIISGGSTPNVVPESSTATLNLRVTPRQASELDTIRQELESLYGVSIAQSWQPQPTVCSPTSHIYQTAKQALPLLPHRPFSGVTEQPFFEAHGIPMLTLGPGSDTAMHQSNEGVDIKSIAACKTQLTRIIAAY